MKDLLRSMSFTYPRWRVVRVAAFARRKETQIMKLVGASNTYIRLPFLAEGVVAGLLGTMIAFGLLRAGMFYLDRVRDQVSIFQILPAVGMREFYSSCIILLALGVATGVLALAVVASSASLVRSADVDQLREAPA